MSEEVLKYGMAPDAPPPVVTVVCAVALAAQSRAAQIPSVDPSSFDVLFRNATEMSILRDSEQECSKSSSPQASESEIDMVVLRSFNEILWIDATASNRKPVQQYVRNSIGIRWPRQDAPRGRTAQDERFSTMQSPGEIDCTEGKSKDRTAYRLGSFLAHRIPPVRFS
jgi:hypothetical protein